MTAFRYPINHVITITSRSRVHFVAMTLRMFQLRNFSQTATSRRDDEQEIKEQSHSPYGSPYRGPSLLPSFTNQADVKMPRDTRTSGARFPEGMRETIATMKKLVDLIQTDHVVRQKLAWRGHTAEELETLKRTSEYSFRIRRKDVDKLSSKKGFWTEEEVGILKKMRQDHEHPRIIARHLGRKEQSVSAKIKHLAEYFQECNKAPFYEGPQAYLPELEDSIFRSRLETVWEGLMTLPRTDEWRQVLSESQSESWLSMIETHTPKHVKSIMASHQPPNIAQLESIEWSDTDAAGVYGWVLKPKGRPGPLENECYLWVGSASRYCGGLKRRKENLLSTSRHTQNESPKPWIEYHGLRPTGKLITLLEVPFTDGSIEEVERIRRLVTLARGVFVIWLAAAVNRSKIQEFVPWDPKDILYHGLSSPSLARNINKSKSDSR